MPGQLFEDLGHLLKHLLEKLLGEVLELEYHGQLLEVELEKVLGQLVGELNEEVLVVVALVVVPVELLVELVGKEAFGEVLVDAVPVRLLWISDLPEGALVVVVVPALVLVLVRAQQVVESSLGEVGHRHGAD